MPTVDIAGRDATNQIRSSLIDTSGKHIVVPYAADTSSWSYAAAASGIVNTTTAVTIRAAAGANLRNYITNIQIAADALGAATEIAIRDGAAGPVLWRGKVQTAGLPFVNFDLNVPLRGSLNTLLEVVTLSATVTGGVYFNCQGYSAP